MIINYDAQMKRVYIVTFVGIALAIMLPIYIASIDPGPYDRSDGGQVLFTILLLGPIFCGLYDFVKAAWFGWHKEWWVCLKSLLCGVFLIGGHFIYGMAMIIITTGGSA